YGRPSNYFTPRNVLINENLRGKLEIPLDAVVCLTSARIEKRKGYQYQLQAIEQLRSTPVWNHLYFIWVGGGVFEPEFETELQEKVKQLKITDKVKFLGQQENVSKLLDVADIFILTSELEGMPLSVMEAMSKGLPVIATAVSGIPEELGNTGQLIADPKHDPKATVRELCDVLKNWVMNAELRQRIGMNCKKRAEKMFKEERMIQETISVIERALLPEKDYVSPGLKIVQPDQYFPNMIVGNPARCSWPYLRRDISHNWYVDRRQPTIGFLSRDEAQILYNTALKFKHQNALEIGCWMGWSACHLGLAGVKLDVIDPILNNAEIYNTVTSCLR
ncbi:MAG: glycosyltransferase, partial [Planktothrix sp.]|uniref:glycosyltransferase n=1 Tax=Planktothrix sp. TaxID=3088171 RepID=UPI0038D4A6E1